MCYFMRGEAKSRKIRLTNRPLTETRGLKKDVGRAGESQEPGAGEGRQTKAEAALPHLAFSPRLVPQENIKAL